MRIEVKNEDNLSFCEKYLGFKPVYSREEFLSLGAEEIARRANIAFIIYFNVGLFVGFFIASLVFNN